MAVLETAGLTNGRQYHQDRQANHGGTVCWTTPGLKVTRLRLLSDPGYPIWDVSYCHGTLNGKDVDVQLPFSTLPKNNLSRFIVNEAKKWKVYARGLGILGAISTLN